MMFDWGGGTAGGGGWNRGVTDFWIQSISRRYHRQTERVSTAPLTTPLQVKPYSTLAHGTDSLLNYLARPDPLFALPFIMRLLSFNEVQLYGAEFLHRKQKCVPIKWV